MLTTALLLAQLVAIPGGSYRPLYGAAGDAAVSVASFRLDRAPVTRREFLAFVTAHPEWRRSRASSSHAASGAYLRGWTGDLDAGGASDLDRPVTEVSWFAARAYCAALGRRLPSTREWEYVAGASRTASDASRDRAFVQSLVARYATRSVPLPATASDDTNVYGVRGLHAAWELVADFPAAPADAHAHHHERGARGRDQSCASAALGAPDPTNYPAFLRHAVRAALDARTSLASLTFRCAA